MTIEIAAFHDFEQPALPAAACRRMPAPLEQIHVAVRCGVEAWTTEAGALPMAVVLASGAA
jgi:hypothetical protein